jgi:AcrR family transcriptional regulator
MDGARNPSRSKMKGDVTDPTPAAVESGRHALTRRRILDTALDLVDADGLEALSMRRLGAALGVEAMSLYYHFPSKAALLDGLVATVLGQIPLPEATPTGWEDAVRRGFTDFRRLLLAHPALFPLIAGSAPAEREGLAPVARAFAVLEAAGFEPREAGSAWSTLLSYTFGFVQCEISGKTQATRLAAIDSLRRPHWKTEVTRVATIESVTEHLADPDLAAFRTSYSTLHDWDDDSEFAKGLDVVIAGLGACLGPRPGDP